MATIDGFPAYAPDLAAGSGQFPTEKYPFLYDAEPRNFWFTSRNRLLRYVVRRFMGKNPSGDFLETGCGTGFVLAELARFPGLRLFASEIHTGGLRFARQRVPQAELFQMDATRIPFTGRFDAAGAFDVIEHIPDDRLALRELHRALKAGGWLFLTVPQHPFLWSHTDETSCHQRRYRRDELRAKVTEAGFEVRYTTSFVFLLLPLMFLARRFGKPGDERGELQVNPALNALFTACMRFDELLIRLGVRLPWGGSLLLAARKPYPSSQSNTRTDAPEAHASSR